jgi:hypothetical protein
LKHACAGKKAIHTLVLNFNKLEAASKAMRHRLPGKVVAPVFVIGRNFQLQAKNLHRCICKEEGS